MFGYIFVLIMLVMFDQFTKVWVRVATIDGPLNFIPGFFRIVYVENTGAAFSILQGQRWLLVGVTAVFLAVLAYMLFKNIIKQDMLVSGALLILSGGLSNLIDRVFRGYVVDYFDFSLFDFPVFNLADVCVVMGTAVIIYYILLVEPKEKKRLAAQGAFAQNPPSESPAQQTVLTEKPAEKASSIQEQPAKLPDAQGESEEA